MKLPSTTVLGTLALGGVGALLAAGAAFAGSPTANETGDDTPVVVESPSALPCPAGTVEKGDECVKVVVVPPVVPVDNAPAPRPVRTSDDDPATHDVGDDHGDDAAEVGDDHGDDADEVGDDHGGDRDRADSDDDADDDSDREDAEDADEDRDDDRSGPSANSGSGSSDDDRSGHDDAHDDSSDDSSGHGGSDDSGHDSDNDHGDD